MNGRRSYTCTTVEHTIAETTAIGQPKRIWLARMKTKASDTVSPVSSTGTGSGSAATAVPRETRRPLSEWGPGRGGGVSASEPAATGTDARMTAYTYRRSRSSEEACRVLEERVMTLLRYRPAKGALNRKLVRLCALDPAHAGAGGDGVGRDGGQSEGDAQRAMVPLDH